MITNFVLADAEETAEIGSNQSNVVLLTVIDLLKEVKELHCLVKEQNEKMEKRMTALELKLAGLGEKSDKMASTLVDTVGQVETRLVGLGEKSDKMASTLVDTVGQVETRLVGDVSKIDNKIEVWRSEVRLISQQKLTWQNKTYDPYFSDFVVDGVYTLSENYNGINPIQHMADGQVNYMLIIELGGLFKIHSVKIWNRIDCCRDRLGVVIYADDELLGSIFEEKMQYNFHAREKVYARKIYLKQVNPTNMNYIEVQVFGNGPYGDHEVKELNN